MSRLVIVSNRVAVAKDSGKTRGRAGGLAVAIEAVLRKSEGLWFGWSGEVSRGRPRSPHITEAAGVTYATLDLTPDDRTEYYNGFANRTLWPLFHYRTDLAVYDRQQYQGYLRVNALFARHLARLLKPDDVVWIHDYHLIPMGQELRRLGCRQSLGFFLHIPFPAEQLLLTLPGHEALAKSLLAYDLVGFQTDIDLRAFHDYIRLHAGGQVTRGAMVTAFGESTQSGAFAIGIDTEDFVQMADTTVAQRQFERTRESLHGSRLIIGVDRLDYSKGLHERFRAFERLLEVYPASHDRVSLMQVAPPTRSEVPEYRAIRRDLERLTGHINGRFGQPHWVPIQYMNRSFSRRHLAGLYRAAQVGLVTPFRDGMNLVAMEYVAAQAEEDPGVLVLSQFAGAAQVLPEAIIINPYDIQAVTDAIQHALRMSLDERRQRWLVNMDHLRRNDLAAWRDAFLGALSRIAAAA